ncbi:MAG: peptidylprolyl isomerase [Myxococcales bacterium]|nr:peptidylprolyl isomerase [Myxococcales bacterium]
MRGDRRAVLGLIMACGLALGCDSPPPAGQPADASASAPAAASVTAAPAASSSAPVVEGPPLLTPKAATGTAPDSYDVVLDTTKGKATIRVTRAWAPRAADRFHHLVKIGYYDDVPFYRVTLEVAQFGIHGDPKVNEAWREAYFMDEMVKHPNEARTVSFARRGSDTRTTQIFINLKDNSADFDDQGFAPFGEVVEGFDEVIAKLSHEHGERPQQGDAPKRMMAEGAPFIKKEFPKLDWIKSAKLKE